MKRIILILIILTLLILTTGCWDKLEINQRTFPYSVAIDLNDGEGDKYTITMSYINLNGIGNNATQEDIIYMVSTTASSIFEASHKLSTKLAYPIYFKHLRVLILGEEVAKDEHCIRQIVDGLNRDFVVNKRLNIATAEGKAEDILKTVLKSPRQEEIEGSLFSLLKDNRETSRYTSKTLTEFMSEMENGAVTVPRIKAGEGEVVIFGSSIFKNYKAIGYIDEIESRSITFLRDKVNMELIDAPYKDGNSIFYEMTGENVKRELIVDGENLIAKIDIEVEGALQEYVISEEIEDYGVEELKEMERAIKEKLEEEINHVIYLFQKKYNADAIGMEEYIWKFYPKVWKEIEENWEEVFAEMQIDVTVIPNIRRRGLIN